MVLCGCCWQAGTASACSQRMQPAHAASARGRVPGWEVGPACPACGASGGSRGQWEQRQQQQQWRAHPHCRRWAASALGAAVQGPGQHTSSAAARRRQLASAPQPAGSAVHRTKHLLPTGPAGAQGTRPSASSAPTACRPMARVSGWVGRCTSGGQPFRACRAPMHSCSLLRRALPPPTKGSALAADVGGQGRSGGRLVPCGLAQASQRNLRPSTGQHAGPAAQPRRAQLLNRGLSTSTGGGTSHHTHPSAGRPPECCWVGRLSLLPTAPPPPTTAALPPTVGLVGRAVKARASHNHAYPANLLRFCPLRFWHGCWPCCPHEANA